ncbi:MAG: 4-alpha-glucanotransferase [Acidimicrobiia bacterium]|nr:4-alpha-glucanotransferase [Acidimicrobiia bacterium]
MPMLAVRPGGWDHRRVPNARPFPARTFGVLLHPTSLAGPEPIGTLGAEAEAWVDWLATTGAGVWQILPLTVTGDDGSPYFSPSAFAGNTSLIDLRDLAAIGLLDEGDLHPPTRRRGRSTSRGRRPPADPADGAGVDREALARWKQPLLTAAADRFLADRDHRWRAEYDEFVATAGETWLTDVCHFFALKDRNPDTPWWEWDDGLRTRRPRALARSRKELAADIERSQVLQFLFEQQWQRLRSRANQAGILVLGDVPIYVSPDSADVWTNQDQFELDRHGRQLTQAGVPPDYFSDTGQLWKNPLYRWDVMAADGYSWWINRLGRTLEQVDVVRIDHFRALSAYWSVPAADATAVNGTWVPGPGQPFVDALRRAFPDLPIVAEDLGDLDDDVLALRDDNDLVGMRVVQFGFSITEDPGRPSIHHPSHVDRRSVVYTGTHDNDTLAGWWRSLPRRLRTRVRADTAMPPRVRTRRAVWWLVGVTLNTKAVAAIIPLQDLLALDSAARMNTPSTTKGNWGWRMPPDCLTAPLAADIRALAAAAKRAKRRIGSGP